MISLYEAPDTEIDAQEAIRQIGWGDTWRMARLGAKDVYYSESSGYVQFDTSGLGRKLRVVIKLAADDTYSVEIGRFIRKTLEYVVLAQEHGHYTDSMGPAIERLVIEHTTGRR